MTVGGGRDGKFFFDQQVFGGYFLSLLNQGFGQLDSETSLSRLHSNSPQPGALSYLMDRNDRNI